MKSKYFLLFIILILQTLPFHSVYGHTIGSSLGHSYGTVYTILYFIGRIIPFIGLGILAKYPARQIGYSAILWQFIATLGTGIVLGYHFHDYLSTAYFNYFLTAGIGFLMLFYTGKYPFAIRSIILLCCLPLGFDFGLHFNHADAWLGYMISICVTAIVAFLLLTKIFIKFNNRLQWVQQMIGILLVIAAILSILLF